VLAVWEGAHHWDSSKQSKKAHGRLFLQASGLRAHWLTLIQHQRHDRDLSLAERVKRQQGVIDSPQSRLSNNNGR
jgi:hypothetical protein